MGFEGKDSAVATREPAGIVCDPDQRIELSYGRTLFWRPTRVCTQDESDEGLGSRKLGFRENRREPVEENCQDPKKGRSGDHDGVFQRPPHDGAQQVDPQPFGGA